MTTGEEVLQIDPGLAERVRELCGENAYLCYQCRKCTSGCPLADAMDLAPNQAVRAIQLGQLDLVLNSTTLWLCASCQTCVTRCPHGIDLPRIMDALRAAALATGVKPRVPSVARFYQVASRDIKLLGRLYEVGLMAELNLRSGQVLKDMPLALQLLRRGKLKMLPQVARGAARQRARPQMASDEVAYFPGCSSHGTAREYDQSARTVAALLGVKLVEPEGWVCCGTSAAHATSHLMATALPMRNLGLVEAAGQRRLTTPCAACFARFKTAAYDIQRDEELRRAVEAQTGYAKADGVQVEHLLDTFTEGIGYDRVHAAVKRPLTGLKVVCYYGCLLTRPSEVTGAEHIEYPMNMDYLLRAVGVETLDWSYKTECCGSNLALTETELALRLSERILKNAVEVGAEAIVVACPLCHSNLDARQPQIGALVGRAYRLPVLYFTQVLGLALGANPKQMGIDKHITNAEPLLAGKGLAAMHG